MAHTNELHEQGNVHEITNETKWEKQGQRQARPCCPSYHGVSYAPSKRSQKQGTPWFASDPAEIENWETDQSVRKRITETWGIESRLDRVAHGVAHRVDRLKAIGNGQIPIVAATIWKILSEELE